MTRSAIKPLPYSLGDIEWDLADKARTDLALFVEEAWPVIEPATEFVPNWHIDAICDHLEAFVDRDIKNLLINIPPGHMKSLLAAVFLPAWAWIERPHLRWLYASHEMELVRRDSVKCRRIIQSNWYQRHYGESFRLTGDQNAKDRFDNNMTGSRLTTSVGGGTGERGDFVLTDDPHQTAGVLSDVKREAARIWWSETMPSRMNDIRLGGKLVIMQRLHQGDISGIILKEEKDEFEHLMLPAEFEPARKCYTSIGFEDPREREGELLFPERFPAPEMQSLKTRLGSYGASAQLQQRPAPRGGGLLQWSWFQRFRLAAKPANPKRIIQSWDTAMKPDELAAYSVCGTWLEVDNGFYLIEVFRERLGHPELIRMAKSIAMKHQPNAILIEDKASGTSLIQHLRDETVWAIIPVEPRGDKVMRMETETPAIEAGRVYLPDEAPWLPDFMDEIVNFPVSEHKDQIDMMSQALKYFREQAGFVIL